MLTILYQYFANCYFFHKNKKISAILLRLKVVVPRGIEPLIPPWKGGVLTAWPWDHVPTFGAVIICTRVCKFLLCRSRHIIWGTTDLFFLIAPFPFSKRLRSEILHKCLKCFWWRWVESNYRSIGYEPIALTAEPHRHDNK